MRGKRRILDEIGLERALMDLPAWIKLFEVVERGRIAIQVRTTHLAKQVLCKDCLKKGMKRDRAIWVPTKTRKQCPRCGSKLFQPAGRRDPLLERFLPRVKQIEDELKEEIFSVVRGHPVWHQWAYAVKGIGEISLGRIMGHCDIEMLDTVAEMWAHAGLGLEKDGTPQRKEKKKKITYDAKLQAATCILGSSLMRAQGKYYSYYLSQRHKFEAKGLDKGHAHNRAFRHMRKLVLSHIWEVWRRAEDLPAPRPYAFDILKHSTDGYIAPEMMMEK